MLHRVQPLLFGLQSFFRTIQGLAEANPALSREVPELVQELAVVSAALSTTTFQGSFQSIFRRTDYKIQRLLTLVNLLQYLAI